MTVTELIAGCDDGITVTATELIAGSGDAITTVTPALSRVGDFAAFLHGQFDGGAFEPIRWAKLVGRPVGSADFIAGLQTKLRRPMAARKCGPKAAVAE